jgi:hypothetical protein
MLQDWREATAKLPRSRPDGNDPVARLRTFLDRAPFNEAGPSGLAAWHLRCSNIGKPPPGYINCSVICCRVAEYGSR